MESGVIVFIVAIAYALILSIIVGHIVEERISQLKYFQVTQGMQLSAYWITTFLGDLIKFYLTILSNYLIFIGFDLGFKEAFLTLLVYPLGILPFTYVTSFAFQSSSVGQSLTLFFNFLFLLILPVSVHWIRLLKEFEKQGDFLN